MYPATRSRYQVLCFIGWCIASLKALSVWLVLALLQKPCLSEGVAKLDANQTGCFHAIISCDGLSLSVFCLHCLFKYLFC